MAEAIRERKHVGAVGCIQTGGEHNATEKQGSWPGDCPLEAMTANRPQGAEPQVTPGDGRLQAREGS
jgi:hypothetical protein